MSRSDSLAPIITIYDPPSGTTRTTNDLTIKGYALDDKGIEAIRVNGSDLLADPLYQGERGKKLIEFRFRMPELREGEMTSTIVAEDTKGRVTTLNYQLQIDTTPPVLQLNEVTQVNSSTVRVRGVATDNDQVSSIMIGGEALLFAPTAEHSFNLDVPSSEGLSITVSDRAGNVLVQPLNP